MRSRSFLFFVVLGAIAQGGCFLVQNDDAVSGNNDDAGSDAAPQDAGTDRWLVVDANKPVLPGVVLFAGDGPQFFQDTWQFDGAAWSEEDTPSTNLPPVRYGHRLAALNGKVYLFGGQGLDGFLNDTWSWDGKNWTQLSVSGPSPRANMGMTTYQGKILMYGGDGGGSVGTETWEFDGTTWTQLNLTGPNPGNCIGPAMTTLGDKVVLYGGVGAANHTWTWDGSTWSDQGISAIGDRSFMQMATIGDKAYLFGGEEDANHILADTWAWDGSTWTQMQISGPPARFQYGMTTYNGKIVLFGGNAPVGGPIPFLGDTWTFDGSTWTNVTANADGPPGRLSYTLAPLVF